MKRGSNVTQILPAPFAGKVTHFAVDQETGDKLVHVQAESGEARFFKAEELQVGEDQDTDPETKA